MPHGMCYLWDSRILFAQISADAFIALAYFSIPICLLWLVRKRQDLPFSWVFVLFAIFIVSCGLTHVLSIWVIWHPDYWMEAIVKWVTAIASIATAIAVVPLAPKLLAFQSRAQAVEALRESESRLQLFLRTIPQMVWTANAAGDVDWYNERWFEFTGQSRAEAHGWGWQHVHHPEDLPLVMKRWRKSIETGEPFEMEFRLLSKDGTFRWFLTRVLPEICDGVIIRWYGSNTDVDARKRELERASHIAGTLQAALLPTDLPVNDKVCFDALYRPAESDALVGGDWYDAFTLPDGRILMSCGDVAGHGVNAAMLAGRFRQNITALGIENPDPADILLRINRTTMVQDDGIATAVVALYDSTENTLTYASAGHPPPAVAFRARKAKFFEMGGLPLGVMSDASWVSHTITLEAGAMVVFYTDGVTEFSRDMLDAEQRLLEAAASLVGVDQDSQPARTIRQLVMQSAPATDDVAILVLKCLKTATPMGSFPQLDSGYKRK